MSKPDGTIEQHDLRGPGTTFYPDKNATARFTFTILTNDHIDLKIF